MTKKELAKHLGDFATEHGVDETSKVLSRMLLSLVHSIKADSFEFTDEDVGSVIVTPKRVQKHLIN